MAWFSSPLLTLSHGTIFRASVGGSEYIFIENIDHLYPSICCCVSEEARHCSKTQKQPCRLVDLVLQQLAGWQLLQPRAVLCSALP